MAPSRRPPSRPAAIRSTEVAAGLQEGVRRGGPLAWAMVLIATTACRVPAPAEEAARSWALGPARWLLVPEERRQLTAIRTAVELESFVGAFWAKRDPDPGAEGNPFSDTFQRRVADADLLYGGGAEPGSLTDRGGALILLGPPQVLRHTETEGPSLGDSPASTHPTESFTMEVWVYLLQHLPRALQEELRLRRGPVADVSLTFLVERHRTRLVEGRELLELAARSGIRIDGVE